MDECARISPAEHAARELAPESTAPPADSSQRLRVGILIDRWQPDRGGAERALARLAERLVARGHEVIAFGREGPGRSEDGNAPASGGGAGVTFRRVRAFGVFRVARERRLANALVAAAADARCDVTVGVRHLARVDVYWPHGGSHVATLAAKHGPGRWYPLLSRHRAFLDLEARLFRAGGARRIVCVSELVRRELVEAFPRCADRLVVVPNGVDLERFHPRERARAGARLRAELELAHGEPLLVLAAHEPWLKGLSRLLEALGGLAERPWRLLVAGPRRPARWRLAARRRGFSSDRVEVRSREDPVALAAAADLAVQPTLRDPCSLATLEALACGTPVLTTRANGAAEAIREPAQGVVLADPRDVGALRRALAARLDALASGAASGAVSGAAIGALVERERDRERVRAAVLDRGLEPWLDRLEAVVLDAAAEARAERATAARGSAGRR